MSEGSVHYEGYYKKHLALFISIILILATLSIAAIATDATYAKKAIASPRAGIYNPYFTRCAITAYNTSTGSTVIIGEYSWPWGEAHPPTLKIPKETYYVATNEGCNVWVLNYTGNAKDATYLRIHNGNGTTFAVPELKQNQTFTATVRHPLYSSFRLNYDRTVDGWTNYNLDMGGLEVVF